MYDATGRLPIDPQRATDESAQAGRDPRTAPEIAALTRQMVAGDETAYRVFYEAYYDRLSRYLLVVTAGNEDATREALQETLRRVVRHIRVFADEAAFWSWLTVLARSARSDEGRKRRRYRAFLDRFTQHAAVDRAGANDERESETLEALLLRSLGGLPIEERSLLESKYFEHRSVQEIAVQLGTTEKAVESRLMRVRQKLKQAVLAELKHEARE